MSSFRLSTAVNFSALKKKKKETLLTCRYYISPIGLLSSGKSACGTKLWLLFCKIRGNNQQKVRKEKPLYEKVANVNKGKKQYHYWKHTLSTNPLRTKGYTYLANKMDKVWITAWSIALIRILLHITTVVVGGPICGWNPALPNYFTGRPGCSFILARGTTKISRNVNTM